MKKKIEEERVNERVREKIEEERVSERVKEVWGSRREGLPGEVRES